MQTRPFEPDDLPRVVSLLRSEFPQHAPSAPEEVSRFIRSIAIDHPWADPAVPSLVTLADDGSLIGFIASHVRRLRAGAREIRAAVCSHLSVAEAHRGTAAGALLMKSYLNQGQELTYTDTATEPVMRMWKLFGGKVDPLRSTEWMLMLRPVALGASVLRRRLGGAGGLRGGESGHARVPFGVLVGRRISRPAVGVEAAPARPATGGPVRTVPLTDSLLMEHAPAILAGSLLHVDYDPAYLSWLFAALTARTAVPIVRRMVFAGDQPLGWFVYALRRNGVSLALQVATDDRRADAVFGALTDHARAAGTAALTGRTERPLVEAIRRSRAVLGFSNRFVWHTKDPEIDVLMKNETAQISRLDGEWW